MILILAALLVLSAVGTAGAQETIDGGRLMPVSPQMFGPSPYDLVAPWGKIDGEDIKPLALALIRSPGPDVPWAWDLNHDGVIDIADIGMVAARYGCTVVDACYW